jgi:hypothetical protein
MKAVISGLGFCAYTRHPTCPIRTPARVVRDSGLFALKTSSKAETPYASATAAAVTTNGSLRPMDRYDHHGPWNLPPTGPALTSVSSTRSSGRQIRRRGTDEAQEGKAEYVTDGYVVHKPT